MTIKSRWQTNIPQVSLPTFLFGSPTGPLPEKAAFIDAERPEKLILTIPTYRKWAKQFAAGLRKAGFQRGDRLMLYSGNTLFFPVVLMGTIMAGGIFTGANPTYIPREVAYQLKDSGARFLITSEASVETALEAIKIAGVGIERLFVFDDGEASFEGRGKPMGDIKHWTSLLGSEAEGEAFVWDELRTPEELNRTVALNYSSGTTGVPKGVQITHRNYVSNCAQTEYVGKITPESISKLERTRHLCFLPLYHAMGQTLFCVSAPKNQAPVYIMARFDFLKMLEAIQKFKITYLTMVPPIAIALAKQPVVKNFDLSSVEGAGSGAAPLSGEITVAFEALWPKGQVNLKQGWGMTEITCTATIAHPDEIIADASVGQLAPNMEAKLMEDDEVTEAPPGGRGEVWIKGPNVMKGYWNKPDATKGTFSADGWLKTGDIAHVDERGHFYIVDRKKELIKVKGNQVAPAELEALLLEHPAVADAAVIGVTVDGDEMPRAYLVLQQGKSVKEQDIQEYMNKKVTKTKRLTGGVRFVEMIPKNPSGKILRKTLRDQANAEKGLQAKL